MTLIRVSPIKKGNYYTYNKLYIGGIIIKKK